MDVLDLRQLNRATLARQGLLEHSSDPIAVVVDRVGGIQAQQPGPMATGLWSRIEDFAREDLCAAALDGSIVRGTSLRITLHLHSVDDYRALRMTLQPMLDRWVQSQWVRGRVREQDVEPAIELGRELLSGEAMTIGAIKAGLAARFPQSDPQGLGNVVRTCMQLLMVPDAEAPNGWPTVAAFTEARRLVGDTLAEEHDVVPAR